MLLIILAAIVAYGAYRYWNHVRPTDHAGRLLRAGILSAATGAATMPWLWWSGLPEAALAAGIITLILTARRRHRTVSPVA